MPLQIGKTPIVVPRQHQYNEHVNDHQVEFARNVAQRMGTIIPVEDINTLGDVITNYDQIVAGMEHDPKDSYTKVKQRLSEGKKVLFTGTPCQIAGLYAFLGGNPENLYTVDLICHGVPSPKFFKKYLEYQNKQTAGRVIYFNFRSKDKRGWGTQYLLKRTTKT